MANKLLATINFYKKTESKYHIFPKKSVYKGIIPQNQPIAHLFTMQVCENLADGNHSSEQQEVQSTVQKFNSAALVLKTIPLIFVIIFLGSW